MLTILQRVAQRLGELAPVLAILVSEYTRDSELAAYLRSRTLNAGQQAMSSILEHATTRGDTDLATIPDRIVALPVTLVVHDALLHRRTPLGPELEEIVDTIFLPLVMDVPSRKKLNR